MKRHAIIVGGGFGGLSAAIGLASRGLAVTLVEAADQLGGKAGTASSHGVDFDTGPSLLTLPDVFDTLFALGGSRLRDRVRLRRLDPTFRYLFADGSHLYTSPELDTTLSDIRATFGRQARDEMADFLSYAEKIWRASAPHFVYGPSPSLRSLSRMKWRTLTQLRHIDPTRTMWQAISDRVKHPHIRAILMRFATYNGSDVRTAPAALNCIAHVDMAMGAHGVEGGMSALAQALVDLGKELGVQYATNTKVSAITTRWRRVTGVELESGAKLHADAVVCNADVRHLAMELAPGLRAMRNRVEQLSPSMSAVNFVIKAKRRRTRAPHNVIFPSDYMREFEDIFDHQRVPREPTIYLCDQALSHGKEAFADGSVPVFAMVNAPATNAPSAVNEPGVRAFVMDRIKALGLVGDDAEIVWSRTPGQLEERFPGSQGSIYGAASNSARSAFTRPGNRVRELRGLYLAGGSVHPGGGVPLCTLSGIAAAQAVVEDVGAGTLRQLAIAN